MAHRSAPIVVGVVNVTPDSFSDGGEHGDGIAHAVSLLEAGADWIDVGGESTRPGAVPVDADTEWARVRPLIEALSNQAVVSIDTSKASVAARALKAGAAVINDVTGLSDPQMAAVTADAEQTVIMHMRGTPVTMRTLNDYEDLVEQVANWLVDRASLVRSEGCWIDPGIGFAKDAQQSLKLLAHTERLVATGLPVMIGASRKSFIGHTLGIDDPTNRLGGSLAAVAAGWASGAQAFRVHDVSHTRQLLDLLYAIEGAA